LGSTIEHLLILSTVLNGAFSLLKEKPPAPAGVCVCLCYWHSERQVVSLDKKKTKKIPPGSLWGRGYFVLTVGINEMTLKKYVEEQQHRQVEMFKLPF
jgi:putative transposase